MPVAESSEAWDEDVTSSMYSIVDANYERVKLALDGTKGKAAGLWSLKCKEGGRVYVISVHVRDDSFCAWVEESMIVLMNMTAASYTETCQSMWATSHMHASKS
jgi:hypothetical protein